MVLRGGLWFGSCVLIWAVEYGKLWRGELWCEQGMWYEGDWHKGGCEMKQNCGEGGSRLTDLWRGPWYGVAVLGGLWCEEGCVVRESPLAPQLHSLHSPTNSAASLTP